MQEMGLCVSCVLAVGRRIWVGLADGRIRVLGNPQQQQQSQQQGAPVIEEEWLAHENGVFVMALARSRVITMSADGSIRAWCSMLPCQPEHNARCVF